MAEIIKHKKEAPLVGLVGMGGGLTGFGLVGPGVTPPGQANYADGHSGSYSWVCPPGVTSVSIVCIGGGASGSAGSAGRGGGGGACAYKNNITVVPGTSYSLQVGAGGQNSLNGGESWFKVSGSAVVKADYGHGYGSQNDNSGGSTSQCIGDGSYAGGQGGISQGTHGSYGGKSGTNNGDGNGHPGASGNSNGEGPGGAGSNNGLFIGGGAGGGGTLGGYTSGKGGGGGGGGNIATVTGLSATAGQGGNWTHAGDGGRWGGGGGAAALAGHPSYTVGDGGHGAVRIVWPGDTKSFPATDVGDD